MLEQWHDLFMMVGGAAAALAGLVFVAISVNLDMITRDATHMSRAIGTLVAFTATFMISAFVLMGDQSYQALGMEWLVVSSIALFVYIYGYIRARKLGGSPTGLHPGRITLGITLHLAQMLGSVLLVAGYDEGLYIASVALVLYVGFMISGTWLLIINAHQNKQTDGSG
jgi:hypothetical protein